MKKYETVMVFDGALPEETIAKEQQGIEGLIKKECSLVTVDVWGKKTLAYPINDKKSGFYCLFVYEYDKDANALINDSVRYNDNVLRTMTVIADDSPVVAQKSESGAVAAPTSDDSGSEGEE
ncbi:30S ribosomal protein S6 [Chitinivibrio alkaliphilus]|uniref:Small ribosomal subunit protein bS6 n=1 Tax=Chitinivibrio alkaliphilus ACht1 TaxID=1313304 RepID=U7D6D4_9BACT|nr:30S ribosomal protein S6 [Chitinivibrio alkaliphilus]ERP31498.1 30S ribosomal protein S6 [Chitinivibrio alkaliphilus ACht1]